MSRHFNPNFYRKQVDPRQLEAAKKEIEYQNKRDIALQMALAAAMIEIHNRFQVGPGRAEPILDDILGTILDIKDMIEKDADTRINNDPDLTWTHQKLYETLERIFGDTWDRSKGAFDKLLPEGSYEQTNSKEEK